MNIYVKYIKQGGGDSSHLTLSTGVEWPLRLIIQFGFPTAHRFTLTIQS